MSVLAYMGYYYYDVTYLLVILGAVLSMIASAQVNSTFKRYSRVRSSCGMTGAEAAVEAAVLLPEPPQAVSARAAAETPAAARKLRREIFFKQIIKSHYVCWFDFI